MRRGCLLEGRVSATVYGIFTTPLSSRTIGIAELAAVPVFTHVDNNIEP